MPSPFLTSSGKEMPVRDPDPESVPLADYRKEETERIFRSPKPIVLVGSCGGTGKSTQFRRWEKEGSADYGYRLDSLLVTKGERTSYADTLVVDEAGTPKGEGAFSTIRQYRKLYRKIIIASGGTYYTPEEQGAYFRQHTIPPEIPDEDIETALWTLKLLNRLQTFEILQATFRNHLVFGQPEAMPTRGQLRAMIDAVIPELRLPFIVTKTAEHILHYYSNEDYRHCIEDWCSLGTSNAMHPCKPELVQEQARRFEQYMNGETLAFSEDQETSGNPS